MRSRCFASAADWNRAPSKASRGCSAFLRVRDANSRRRLLIGLCAAGFRPGADLVGLASAFVLAGFGRLPGDFAALSSRLLDAREIPCSAGPRCWSRITLEPSEHALHLLLGVGVVELEVLEVFERPAHPGADPFVAVVQPAANLPLNHPGVVQIVALRLRQGRGLLQAADGVVDRRDRLLLHGEHAGQLFAQLAAAVVELAGCVFLGNDPQPDLAALAEVRALDRIEVERLGVERDHGPDRQFERGELPVVRDFLVLHE